MKRWDAFISHAGEDKAIALELADALQAAGLKIWIDRQELRIGDSLREKILRVVSVLETTLRIPGPVIKQCLYVETAMGVCWSTDSEPSGEEHARLLGDAAFAEAILRG